MTEYGMAMIIVVGVGYGLWRVIQWIGNQFLIPIRDSFLSHLDAVSRMMDSVPPAVEAVKHHSLTAADSLQKIAGAQNTLISLSHQLAAEHAESDEHYNKSTRAFKEFIEAAIRALESGKDRITADHYQAAMAHLQAARQELS